MKFLSRSPKAQHLMFVLLTFMNYVHVSDYVLVWEVKSRRKRRAQREGSGEPQEDEEQVIQEESRSEKRKAQLGRWRDKFIQNLQSAGLLLEKVQTSSCFFLETVL